MRGVEEEIGVSHQQYLWYITNFAKRSLQQRKRAGGRSTRGCRERERVACPSDLKDILFSVGRWNRDRKPSEWYKKREILLLLAVKL